VEERTFWICRAVAFVKASLEGKAKRRLREEAVKGLMRQRISGKRMFRSLFISFLSAVISLEILSRSLARALSWRRGYCC